MYYNRRKMKRKWFRWIRKRTKTWEVIQETYNWNRSIWINEKVDKNKNDCIDKERLISQKERRKKDYLKRREKKEKLRIYEGRKTDMKINKNEGKRKTDYWEWNEWFQKRE